MIAGCFDVTISSTRAGDSVSLSDEVSASDVCVTDSMNVGSAGGTTSAGAEIFPAARCSASRKSLLKIKSDGESFSYNCAVARTSSRQYSASSRWRPARYHVSTERPSTPSLFDVSTPKVLHARSRLNLNWRLFVVPKKLSTSRKSQFG